MAIALLDVNVLLALALPSHVHHTAAHQWFATHQQNGWATCILTQSAFVRLYSNPAVTHVVRSTREAMSLLRAAAANPHHIYWDTGAAPIGMLEQISDRMLGHKQVTDAILLDLAIRKQGLLATFDQRMNALLPPDSPHRQHIELIPVL